MAVLRQDGDGVFRTPGLKDGEWYLAQRITVIGDNVTAVVAGTIIMKKSYHPFGGIKTITVPFCHCEIRWNDPPETCMTGESK